MQLQQQQVGNMQPNAPGNQPVQLRNLLMANQQGGPGNVPHQWMGPQGGPQMMRGQQIMMTAGPRGPMTQSGMGRGGGGMIPAIPPRGGNPMGIMTPGGGPAAAAAAVVVAAQGQQQPQQQNQDNMWG
jgi:hypothetical protein